MPERLKRLDLSQLRSQRVKRLHAYWHGKAELRGALPLRADIEPTEIPDLLPNVMIVEVERDPPRFRYRLVGTRIVDFSHHEFTGTYLDQSGWALEPAFTQAYADVVAGREHVCGFYSWELRSGAIGTCEFALLPLANAAGEIDHVLGMEDFDFPLIDVDPEKMY